MLFPVQKGGKWNTLLPLLLPRVLITVKRETQKDPLKHTRPSRVPIPSTTACCDYRLAKYTSNTPYRKQWLHHFTS